ncbi:MAG TPA: SirB2 family protein, partial [Burkholderiales bacterium]|nr:SirB2 family protein [Burkholderiales bacterium]
MDYATVKTVHVTCAALSYTLFLVRGVWMMRGSLALRGRWVRIAPHVVDTVLLASAITLAVLVRQYPFVVGWLTAKVIALVAYIGLGTIALHRGKTMRMRVMMWIVAQAVFLYIVAVAVTHN